MSKKKLISIVKNPKLTHSKKWMLFEVKHKLTSNNRNREINKFDNIPDKIIKVEPLRPIILPNNKTVNAVNNGRKVIIKYIIKWYDNHLLTEYQFYLLDIQFLLFSEIENIKQTWK